MFTEEEKKFLQAELLSRIEENINGYNSYNDLNSEDLLSVNRQQKSIVMSLRLGRFVEF